MCSTIPLTTIFTTTCAASSTALISKSIGRNTHKRVNLPRNLALQEIAPAANSFTCDNLKETQLRIFGAVFFYWLHTASVARSLKWHPVFVTIFWDFRIFCVTKATEFTPNLRGLRQSLIQRYRQYLIQILRYRISYACFFPRNDVVYRLCWGLDIPCSCQAKL